MLGGINKIHAADLPQWIDALISWYEENKISEKDLVSALEFLSKNNIISLDSSQIQIILEKTTSTKEYEIMVTNGVKHKVPFDVMYWSDWKTFYPDTLVLTRDTGNARPYGSNPYSDYFKDPRVLFPLDNRDERIPLKELVLGFEFNDFSKAYRLVDVESKKIINDKVGNKEILIVSTVPFMGRAFERTVEEQSLEFEWSENVIKDKQTQSTWDLEGKAISGPLEGKQLKRIAYDPGFWFEWAAFHPKTEIYSDSEMKNNPRDIEQMARGQYN